MTPMPSADSPVPHVEKLTVMQALNRAMRDAMRQDETVHVLGEDVGTLGGVFRVTDGLTKEFGERCFDTPLAESGIMGFAIGMAMGGLRPIVEMQFDAFAYPARSLLIGRSMLTILHRKIAVSYTHLTLPTSDLV